MTRSLYPSQSSRILIGASPWNDAHGVQETLDYVSVAFGDIIGGRDLKRRNSPSIDLLCKHILKVRFMVYEM